MTARWHDWGLRRKRRRGIFLKNGKKLRVRHKRTIPLTSRYDNICTRQIFHSVILHIRVPKAKKRRRSYEKSGIMGKYGFVYGFAYILYHTYLEDGNIILNWITSKANQMRNSTILQRKVVHLQTTTSYIMITQKSYQ